MVPKKREERRCVANVSALARLGVSAAYSTFQFVVLPPSHPPIAWQDQDPVIPYKALQYTASEANYGGRVTDADDRITIATIITDFYCADIHKDLGPRAAGHAGTTWRSFGRLAHGQGGRLWPNSGRPPCPDLGPFFSPCPCLHSSQAPRRHHAVGVRTARSGPAPEPLLSEALPERRTSWNLACATEQKVNSGRSLFNFKHLVAGALVAPHGPAGGRARARWRAGGARPCDVARRARGASGRRAGARARVRAAHASRACGARSRASVAPVA